MQLLQAAPHLQCSRVASSTACSAKYSERFVYSRPQDKLLQVSVDQKTSDAFISRGTVPSSSIGKCPEILSEILSTSTVIGFVRFRQCPATPWQRLYSIQTCSWDTVAHYSRSMKRLAVPHSIMEARKIWPWTQYVKWEYSLALQYICSLIIVSTVWNIKSIIIGSTWGLHFGFTCRSSSKPL